MSKYLILADLHCRPIWKDIVAKEGDSCDKIVFLGDYTIPREIILDDPTDACGFLYEVLDFKDKNLDKVVLLRGNHDVASCGYYWARCRPQDDFKVQAYWQTNDVKNWFLKNSQWVYQIPDTNIVCSHAGCSTQFLDNAYKVLKRNGIEYYNGIPVPYTWIISHLNDLEPSELFAFTDNNPFDTSGESETQPCTWIRPYTLLHCGVKDIVHVVGHTSIEHICNIKEECIKTRKELGITEGENEVNNYCDIWCCDNLKNREYLIIEDGEFRVSKI